MSPKVRNSSIVVFMGVLLLAFMFNTQYKILFVKGSSMSPTLVDGEIAVLNKKNDIIRGDIAVAHKSDYWGKKSVVKRIYGVPGDEIIIFKGAVSLNGVSTEYYEKYSMCETHISLKGDEYFLVGDNKDMSSDSLSLLCAGGRGVVNSEDIIFSGNIRKRFLHE